MKNIIGDANPSLSAEICDVINKVLAVDKMDRYQTMDELRLAFEPLMVAA